MIPNLSIHFLSLAIADLQPARLIIQAVAAWNQFTESSWSREPGLQIKFFSSCIVQCTWYNIDNSVCNAKLVIELLRHSNHFIHHLPWSIIKGRSKAKLFNLGKKRKNLYIEIKLRGFQKVHQTLTFSNWCTRKIPLVSLPCEPASWRKHVEIPMYLIGRDASGIHSSLWYAAIGCSEVAMRYFSSDESSSPAFLPPT